MSIHDPRSAGWLGNGFARVRAVAENWNIYQARAVGRFFTGLIPVAMLAGALLDLPDTLPGDTDRTVDLAVAGAAAAMLLFALRWFGQGRGILWGAWLWLLSCLWWQGLVLAAFTAWQLAGADGETDWADIVVSAVLSAGLFIPCNIGLKRIDPDN
jgi:hypothetical protein